MATINFCDCYGIEEDRNDESSFHLYSIVSTYNDVRIESSARENKVYLCPDCANDRIEKFYAKTTQFIFRGTK